MSPIVQPTNYASIDIGSHSVRLLLAHCSAKRVRPLHVQRVITRLAHNFQEGRGLHRQTMQHTITVLADYAAVLHRYRAAAVTCGATGVVRRAANSTAFLKDIERSTGLQPMILTEETEALVSAKGILSVLPPPRELVLAFDLGGGSTELLLLDPRQPQPLWNTSIAIGAATLTAQHLTGDPPTIEALDAATGAVHARLHPALQELRNVLATRQDPAGLSRVVATAGTATTLAAMYLQMTDYQPQRVNGLELSTAWIEQMVNRLRHLSLADRQKLPGLEKGREDVILGGALIVQEILRNLRQPRVTITDAGLLEGLLIRLIEQNLHLPETLRTPLTWQWEKS